MSRTKLSSGSLAFLSLPRAVTLSASGEAIPGATLRAPRPRRELRGVIGEILYGRASYFVSPRRSPQNRLNTVFTSADIPGSNRVCNMTKAALYRKNRLL